MMIQHNLMAVNTHRQLGINNSQVKQSLERLSSGYRINRAADDAAGLAISERMRAQITGLDRAVKNALDGVSLVQTAEGALTEVHSMLNRMVDLATQSANGTYSTDERQKIESELNALKEEIDRISQATNFNGIPLLDGHLDKEWQHVTRVYPSGDVTPATVTANTGLYSPYLGLNGGTLDSLPDNFLTQGDGPITVKPNPLSGNTTSLVFSIQTRDGGTLSHEIEIASQINANRSSPNTPFTIDLTPFGSLDMKTGGIVSGMQTPVAVRGIANHLNTLAVKLSVDPTEKRVTTMEQVDIEGLILQVGDTADDYNKVAVKIPEMSTGSLGLKDITMQTQQAAASSITNIRGAIDSVSTSRGKLGAMQNRLEHTISNLEVSVENMTASESRIRDVDMAKEEMNLTKSDILGQSAQSMLAQANMQPQQVLQLLQ